MGEARWEIRDGERVLGPYADEDVFKAIAGTLPPTTPIRAIGQEEWQPIAHVSPFAEVLARRLASPRAARQKKIDTFGGGCLIQGAGAIVGGALLFVGLTAVSAVLALVTLLLGLLCVLGGLVAGRRMSTRWTCGACGNPISGAEVRLCPTCKASLG